MSNPQLDATWEALSVSANFEPRPGKPKLHEETLFFPEAFTYEMEQAWDHIDNLGKVPGFARLSESRRRTTKDFSVPGMGRALTC
jgi:hypothetical protein